MEGVCLWCVYLEMTLDLFGTTIFSSVLNDQQFGPSREAELSTSACRGRRRVRGGLSAWTRK